MIARFTSARQYRGRLLKAGLWLCAIVLLFQLAASFSHQHDQADDFGDCVACQVAGNLAGALPATPPALLAVFLALVYLAARRPQRLRIVARRYVIPPRHGPPALLPL